MLGEDPDVKEQLFEVLKQYAAERDVESLAEALPEILITEEHQQLIDSVRYPISRSEMHTDAHPPLKHVCVRIRESFSCTDEMGHARYEGILKHIYALHAKTVSGFTSGFSISL